MDEINQTCRIVAKYYLRMLRLSQAHLDTSHSACTVITVKSKIPLGCKSFAKYIMWVPLIKVTSHLSSYFPVHVLAICMARPTGNNIHFHYSMQVIYYTHDFYHSACFLRCTAIFKHIAMTVTRPSLHVHTQGQKSQVAWTYVMQVSVHCLSIYSRSAWQCTQ